MYIHSFELYPTLNFILLCIQKVRGVLMQARIAVMKAQRRKLGKKTHLFKKIKPLKYWTNKNKKQADYKTRDHQWCFSILKENTWGEPDCKTPPGCHAQHASNFSSIRCLRSANFGKISDDTELAKMTGDGIKVQTHLVRMKCFFLSFFF